MRDGDNEGGVKKKLLHFLSRSLVNRWLKRVGVRDKVCPLDESYVWVPKTVGFYRVTKSRGFSYTGYFLPSGHVRAILVQL